MRDPVFSLLAPRPSVGPTRRLGGVREGKAGDEEGPGKNDEVWVPHSSWGLMGMISTLNMRYININLIIIILKANTTIITTI